MAKISCLFIVLASMLCSAANAQVYVVRHHHYRHRPVIVYHYRHHHRHHWGW